MNENVMGFLKKASEDPAMQQQMMQMAKGAASNAGEYSSILAAMAKKLGFNLSAKEIEGILSKLQGGLGNFDFSDLTKMFGNMDMGDILGGLGSMLGGKK